MCGYDDLDSFFAEDAIRYAHNLMGKTYCFRLTAQPDNIVCALTLSNDSIRISDLPRSRKDYMLHTTHKHLRRYPGILLGRFAVAAEMAGRGIGSEAISLLKDWFADPSYKTGCRFLIVDARNDAEVMAFYQKNGFTHLFTSEKQESDYMGLKDHDVLTTRLMYFDLMNFIAA